MCITISRHPSLVEREMLSTKQICVVILWKMLPNLTPLVVRVVQVEQGVEVVLEEVQEVEVGEASVEEEVEVVDIQEPVGTEVVHLNMEKKLGPQ